MKWWRGENTNDIPITDGEREILATYESEVERGIQHTPIWQRRMQQLVDLREKADGEAAEEASLCPGGSMSPRDPSFDPNHDFGPNEICRQCGLKLENYGG